MLDTHITVLTSNISTMTRGMLLWFELLRGMPARDMRASRVPKVRCVPAGSAPDARKGRLPRKAAKSTIAAREKRDSGQRDRRRAGRAGPWGAALPRSIDRRSRSGAGSEDGAQNLPRRSSALGAPRNLHPSITAPRRPCSRGSEPPKPELENAVRTPCACPPLLSRASSLFEPGHCPLCFLACQKSSFPAPAKANAVTARNMSSGSRRIPMD
jgi:hypothetical protein